MSKGHPFAVAVPNVPTRWRNLEGTNYFSNLFVQHVFSTKSRGYGTKARADMKHFIAYMIEAGFNLAPENINEEHFIGLSEFLKARGQAVYARLGTYSVIRTFFYYLEDEHDFVRQNPAEFLTEPTPAGVPGPVLPWPTIRKLLVLASSKLANGRTKSLIFKLQYSVAGRINEITKLRLRDFTFPRDPEEHVKVRLLSKTKWERTSFYPGNLAHELEEHFEAYGVKRPEDLVFPSIRKREVSIASSQLITEFGKLLATLPGNWRQCSTHLLRRSPAQSMVDSGADIAKVSRYLSHSDLRITTEHYARFRRVQLHRAVRKAMPELFALPLSNALTAYAPPPR